MKRRKIEEIIFKTLMLISTLIIVFTLLLIISTIVYKGFPSLTWDMISKVPEGGYYLGKSGGILNAIIGSLLITVGSCFCAFIIGYPIVIYINIYRKKKSWFAQAVSFCFDVLWGIPSIVYGAFGFSLMLLINLQASLIAGIFVITLVILPVIMRAIDEVIKLIPDGLMEAVYSLGATKFEAAFKVLFKQAMPGIITALLIAFGRAIGDAAAVLFTAGYTDYIPTSLMDATATLPLAIFFQLGTPMPEVQSRAYAAALILTVIILIVSILSRVFTNKYKKFKV